MRSLWSRSVSEGRPHLVTISGPPGMGKSRLVTELARAQVTGTTSTHSGAPCSMTWL